MELFDTVSEEGKIQKNQKICGEYFKEMWKE